MPAVSLKHPLWVTLPKGSWDICIGKLSEEITVCYPVGFQSGQIACACRDYKLQASQLVDNKKKEVHDMNLQYKAVTDTSHVKWNIVLLAPVK